MIALQDVTYRYPGAAADALSGVSLDIEPGSFVVVAGLSGSGKSTLLRAIGGLVPHFFGGRFAGRVTVGELDTRDSGPAQMAAVVGSLFQDPETQVLMGTVRAELAFPLENRGWPAGSVARAVEETALALAIDQLLDRPCSELSGGELQRVALGATLVARPAVVCLDEPTSQLDPVAGDELIGLLTRLRDDLDLTVVLSEHRLERCLGVADRVLGLVGGSVAFDGSPEAFLGWAMKESPALVTPGARLLDGLGLAPVPGVRRARRSLRAAGVSCAVPYVWAPSAPKRRAEGPALALKGVWHEIKDGPAILRGVTFEAGSRERIALMGRNGAGKSTLLKHAAGLITPTRGKVAAQGRVALLLQNPSDYLIHDTVGEEATPEALERFHLSSLQERNPRDLSGGERQRLALAIVAGTDTPAVLCLDEPTRGMDRGHKDQLSTLLRTIESAVMVATHDPEFAASFADRVVLLADGRVIADGPAEELLAGGTYFSTETARILGGSALTPEQGIQMLSERVSV